MQYTTNGPSWLKFTKQQANVIQIHYLSFLTDDFQINIYIDVFCPQEIWIAGCNDNEKVYIVDVVWLLKEFYLIFLENLLQKQVVSVPTLENVTVKINIVNF